MSVCGLSLSPFAHVFVHVIWLYIHAVISVCMQAYSCESMCSHLFVYKHVFVCVCCFQTLLPWFQTVREVFADRPATCWREKSHRESERRRGEGGGTSGRWEERGKRKGERGRWREIETKEEERASTSIYITFLRDIVQCQCHTRTVDRPNVINVKLDHQDRQWSIWLIFLPPLLYAGRYVRDMPNVGYYLALTLCLCNALLLIMSSGYYSPKLWFADSFGI